MHNLGTVLSFEVVRALKKKSFWVMALSFPLIIAVIFVIIFLSTKATDQALDKLTNEDFQMAIIDDSGLVDQKLVESVGAKQVDDKAAAVESVRHGDLDGFIYYPQNIAEQQVEVYGKNVGIFEDSRYKAVAENLLQGSVNQEVPAAVRTVVQGNTKFSSVVYRDGEVYDPIKQAILPGVFLVLFYFLIAFFGNQMLTVATEEKENRVVEMLLTTINPRTLIIGKVIALIILAFLQALIILIPVLIGYLALRDTASLPSLDISQLPVDYSAIAIGAAIFTLSLLLFTGLLVFIGAMVPTAKEAGQFFGIVMILIFGPLYAVSLFVSAPDSPLVRVLTLFPFTAPIPMMLRNALGNLTAWETALGLAILALTTVITMLLVVRAFRFGALEYSRKLSLKELLGR